MKSGREAIEELACVPYLDAVAGGNRATKPSLGLPPYLGVSSGVARQRLPKLVFLTASSWLKTQATTGALSPSLAIWALLYAYEELPPKLRFPPKLGVESSTA